MPFAHFLIVFFYCLVFKSSLCILDISPSLNMWFAINFSQSVTCHFMLFIWAFREPKIKQQKELNFNIVQLISIFFYRS